MVLALIDGPVRFNALHRQLPDISHRMLTATLRSLERDGLVARDAFDATPPVVWYEVTERGREFASLVSFLVRWAEARDDTTR